MTDCPHLIRSRCHDCPDLCARTHQPVDEEDCAACGAHEELQGDCEREEAAE